MQHTKKKGSSASATGSFIATQQQTRGTQARRGENHHSLGRHTDVLACSVNPDIKRPIDAGDGEEQRPGIFEGCVDPGFFLCMWLVVRGRRVKIRRGRTYLELSSGSLCGRLARLDFASESVVSAKAPRARQYTACMHLSRGMRPSSRVLASASPRLFDKGVKTRSSRKKLTDQHQNHVS